MTEAQAPNSNTNDAAPPAPTTHTSEHRALLFSFSSRAMLGAILGYAGILVIFFFYIKADTPFSYLIERYGALFLGAILSLTGFYLFSDEIKKRRGLRDERFVDVDARARPDIQAVPYMRLIEKIGALEESSKANIQDLITKFQNEQHTHSGSTSEGFVQYFESIRRVLEQKAAVADEKASILLDKGSNYSRFGITFFMFAIVAWQVIAHLVGFHTQHIYGIASCSILFIFIEFLSAWYLKQYRQFVDTSTYLIKVKSIFDKYMLVYWATRESASLGFDQKKSAQNLIEMLRADIKWPETYLTKNPDLSFAKEALETMTLFAKTIKGETKRVASKQSTAKDDGD